MILVAGATGNVGSSVVRQLVAAGQRVRALTRDPATANFPAGVEAVRGNLLEPGSLSEAFDGIERMFFFTPPQGGPAVVDAARAAGVRQVVLLSSAATQKADPRTNPIAARHDAVEQAVLSSGMRWTFLRPDSFAANALAWAPSIRAESVVRGAYPLSLRNPIHESDVAAVAVAALLGGDHDGAAWLLTGPEALTQAGQAAAIGEAIGREVRFEELTRDDALLQMSRQMPPMIAERLLDYAAKSVHVAPSVNTVVQQVTGRPARSFAQWARDHASAFI